MESEIRLIGIEFSGTCKRLRITCCETSNAKCRKTLSDAANVVTVDIILLSFIRILSVLILFVVEFVC